MLKLPPPNNPVQGEVEVKTWSLSVVPPSRFTQTPARRRVDLGLAEFLEMLRQRQALALVGGADRGAVELVGSGDQPLVDETADDLTVLDQERHLVRAYFEDGAAAGAAGLGGAETRIEEAGVMHSELADEGVVGQHLGGMVRRHDDGFAGRQDVKIVRV